MGIFSRMRDIISSNINAMLDRAEDPEKLIRLMIQEMEDTLVEIKASCAGSMAEAKKVQRELDQVMDRARTWEERAELALDKGREDLAREALMEKRRLQERSQHLEAELVECKALVDRYQDDITQLEQKLVSVREKQRLLVQRHVKARQVRKAQQDIRRADSAEVLTRFSHFENRVERMEAEAELVNFGRDSSLEQEFGRLQGDDEIEQELEALKERKRQAGGEDQGRSTDS
ncbi:MAG: phage shock protein PspA [Desulfarculaceae bacterium]|jgi:phage shock protein A